MVGMHTKNKQRILDKRASVNWIMLVYFASGACSLIDEVVWVRLLKLTLGNTVYASSIVVSVFMGGLAAGAVIMGRYSDRITRRLRVYALLEMLVTVSALLLPVALKLADNIYIKFYQAYQPSHGQLLIVQVVISAVILLVPSMLMGSTLPLLGRFVTSLEKETGHLVGRLYALNTLGAAAGCFLAGFVLIRWLGVMGALFAAAGLNLLVAFGGWVLSRCSSGETPESSAPAEVRKPKRAKAIDGRFYVLVVAFFFSGLISIGYELLWMRSIVHLLGGFTYVFSAVLTVYLVGNVIGAGIGSRLAKRLKEPAGGFAVTLSLLGVCGIFYLPALLVWTLKVLPSIGPSLANFYGASAITLDPIVQSVFLFLVPAIVMGIGFPIALQAWAGYVHKVGRSTAAAYGANTIGAVAGGIITGFVLIPLVGVQVSTAILGLIALWIGAVMWGLFAHRGRVVTQWVFVGVAVFFTLVTFVTPSSLFEILVAASPIHKVTDYTLVSVKEALTTTVSLHRDPKDGSLHLYSSGQSIAGDNYVERGDQKMLGHLGASLCGEGKTVLSVGFGSGETTQCLSLHGLERVDCVEIAPEVVAVSLQYFDRINLGARLDEQVNMIFMDAKNYLHLTDQRYDVIVNDSIHPRDFAENASLYSKEYFENARAHLNRGGMIISWLPTYHMPESVFDSIIGTLMDVFPHVTVWFPATHPAPLVLIIGSVEQQYFSPKRIDKALARADVHKSLAQINITSSTEMLCSYVGDENDLRPVIGRWSVNSDYHPFVEFNTDPWTLEREIFKRFVLDVRNSSVYEHIDWTGFETDEKEQWLFEFQRLYEGLNHLLLAYGSSQDTEKLKHCVDGLQVIPDSAGLAGFLKEVEKGLVADSVKMIVSGNSERALKLAREALRIYPKLAAGWIITSNVMLSQSHMDRALSAARQAANVAPENSNVYLNLGIVLAARRSFDKAVEQYERALQLFDAGGQGGDYERAQILDMMVTAYTGAGRHGQAVKAAREAIELAENTGQQSMALRLRRQLRGLMQTQKRSR